MRYLVFAAALAVTANLVSGSLLTNVNCGGITALKRPTLVSPAAQNTVCTYTIRPSSFRICQVRFDFDVFSLAQPVNDPYPQCTTDTFNVGDIRLCGENAGQHVYVIQNITQLNQPLTVSINTASRILNPGLGFPTWTIRVTQLDCPIGAPLMEIETPETRTFFQDGFLIAPIGCLQYFPDTTGVVESFNLNNGLGTYLGNQKYAICFRRTSETTGIRLRSNIFEIAYVGPVTELNEGYDEVCYSDVETPNRSEDHIFIPYARKVLADYSIRASRFCASSLLDVVTEFAPPGPITMMFNSDTVYSASVPEVGFRFTYELY